MIKLMRFLFPKWGDWVDINVFPARGDLYLLQMRTNERGIKQFRSVLICKSPQYYSVEDIQKIITSKRQQ